MVYGFPFTKFVYEGENMVMLYLYRQKDTFLNATSKLLETSYLNHSGFFIFFLATHHTHDVISGIEQNHETSTCKCVLLLSYSCFTS